MIFVRSGIAHRNGYRKASAATQAYISCTLPFHTAHCTGVISKATPRSRGPTRYSSIASWKTAQTAMNGRLSSAVSGDRTWAKIGGYWWPAKV